MRKKLNLLRVMQAEGGSTDSRSWWPDIAARTIGSLLTEYAEGNLTRRDIMRKLAPVHAATRKTARWPHGARREMLGLLAGVDAASNKQDYIEGVERVFILFEVGGVYKTEKQLKNRLGV